MDDLRIDKRTLQEGLPEAASLADVNRILQRLQRGILPPPEVSVPCIYTEHLVSFQEGLLASFLMCRKSSRQRLFYHIKGSFQADLRFTIFHGREGLISVSYADVPLLRGHLSLTLPLTEGDSFEVFLSPEWQGLDESVVTLECS